MKKLTAILLSILCIIFTFSATGCNGEQALGNIRDALSNLNLNLDLNLMNNPEEGIQIELYLNSNTTKQLSDFIDSEASSVSVSDTRIIEIRDGAIIPKSQGTTYISYKCGEKTKKHTVVVHNGAEFVTSCSIFGATSDPFTASIGQIYQIITSNSSSCPISELKVDAYTSNASIDPGELISISPSGEICFVGIGSCEIWVHSATNAQDNGARMIVSSAFADENLASAVSNWINKNPETNADDVITKTELGQIENLTFSELIDFSEADWCNALPSLKQVVFDLSENTNCTPTYSIGDGKLSYRFIGNESLEYSFSLVSAKRRSLSLSFCNFNLISQNRDAIDLSEVESAFISYDGACSVIGADAVSDGDGFNGITANNLTVTLNDDATVTILGGCGASQSTVSAGCGGIGIYTLGGLAINTPSTTATLSIHGGNGGNGYSYGSDGGTGNSGVAANTLNLSGEFSCYIYGGNGGDGKVGAKGETGARGAKGNNESQGRHSIYGYNGRPGGDGQVGQTGGNGGDGGNAIVTTVTLTIHPEVSLHLASGNGGRGGNGGDGGDGGKGGDGGDDDRWSFAWIDDMSGGIGGDGGKGGVGGSKGLGGSSVAPIVVNGEAVTLSLDNVSETDGQAGSDGVNGRTGSDGARGSRGYAGAGG